VKLPWSRFDELDPALRLLVLSYWALLFTIPLYNMTRTRIPVLTESKGGDPGLFTLLRIILVAAFFLAPLLIVKEWLGLQMVLFALCLLLLYPWWTTRYVALPLRMPRLAYALTAFCGLEWWNDKPEGPVAAAAWTLSRQRKTTKEAIAWAEKHLVPARPLRATTVAAHAMLAAARGQLQETRMLFESMLLMDGRFAPAAIWRLCFEWLATDAAARGDWAAVHRFASHYLAPRVPTLLLLADVAGRPPGKRKASIVEVCRSRLPYPSPSLNPILSGGPAQRRASERPSTIEPNGLAGALRATLESTKPQAGELKFLAECWDAVLGDAQLYERLALRSAALGGGDAGAALDRIRQLVQSDLTDAIGAALKNGETIPKDSHLLNAALHSCRRRLLSDLGERIVRMDARRRKDQPLSAIDEWKEFLTLHRIYFSICTSDGGSDNSIAFYTICARLNVFAVWLLDQKKEKAIANAIFRFLVMEAERNNSPDQALLSRNAKASLGTYSITFKKFPA